VVKQKLLAAENGPIDIFHNCPPLGLVFQVQHFQDFLFFVGIRIAGERGQVDFFDNLFVRRVCIEKFGDVVVLRLELFVNRVTIGDVEDLRDARFGGALASAG